MFAGNTNVVPVIAPLNEYAFTFLSLICYLIYCSSKDLQGLMDKRSLMLFDNIGSILTETFDSHLGVRRNQIPLFSSMMHSNHSPFGLAS